MLAYACMNATYLESFNTYYKLREQRLYDAALATPVNPVDIATGEIAWALLRSGLYAIGFLAITAVLGLIRSPWAVLALPAALLVGFAFGGLTVAATTFLRSWQDFDLLVAALRAALPAVRDVLPAGGLRPGRAHAHRVLAALPRGRRSCGPWRSA